MNRLLGAAERYLKNCTWKDISILKVCLLALGMLMGLAVPARKKKVSAWAASLVFVAAYVPLMAKFLPCLLDEKVDIADIYGEKQL